MGLYARSGPDARKRTPSQLAQKLTDAFAPCADWSEVRVVRNEFGERKRIVAEPRHTSDHGMPYDWAEAA